MKKSNDIKTGAERAASLMPVFLSFQITEGVYLCGLELTAQNEIKDGQLDIIDYVLNLLTDDTIDKNDIEIKLISLRSRLDLNPISSQSQS